MKSRSGGTGAGRFDAGVQRQEVGLLIDLTDLTDELFDGLGQFRRQIAATAV